MLSYKNFGETSLNEIKALLATKGLRLGQAAEGGGEAGVYAQHPDRRGRRLAGDDGQIGRGPGIVGAQPQGASAAEHQHPRELASRTEDELLGCKNFGQTSLNEIKQQLATLGLGLRKLEE